MPDQVVMHIGPNTACTECNQPAKGGELSYSLYTDGKMLAVTKNNVSGFLIRL